MTRALDIYDLKLCSYVARQEFYAVDFHRPRSLTWRSQPSLVLNHLPRAKTGVLLSVEISNLETMFGQSRRLALIKTPV